MDESCPLKGSPPQRRCYPDSDSVSQADPEAMTRLMKGLDKFLERDQDRALFNLPQKGGSE